MLLLMTAPYAAAEDGKTEAMRSWPGVEAQSWGIHVDREGSWQQTGA